MRKRNKFSLSNYHLTTMDMGVLYPISCIEALPGDTIQQSTSGFIRVAPTLAPIMHPCHFETWSFHVPLRLIWDDFESFITGGPDGLDASIPPTCQFDNNTGVASGGLSDHFGVPVGYKGKYSVLPLRAYNLIWNEYFRDQDLTSPIEVSKASGNNTDPSNLYSLKRVAWKKDYFSICRPWPQKGSSVTIPVESPGGSELGIKIVGDGEAPTFANTSGAEGYVSKNTSGISTIGVNGGADVGYQALKWQQPHLKATVTGGSSGGIGSVSLDDLREAFALQRFEEARALFGSRYVEYLRYLGVKGSDARLQRPELLGSGRGTLQWSEVVQTAEGDSPVGTMRGHGVAGVRTNRFRRFIEEHGFVITLACIRPIAVYTQGLDRMWSRETKEDYWQKELEHISEQEVLNKEVYALSDNPDGVFGYMDRYDEYRTGKNMVTGEFRGLLNYWHLAREFASAPALNNSFIACNPSKRVFAEQNHNELYCMFLNSIQARRLVGQNGRPRIL